MNTADHLTVALAQLSPVWLDRESTLEKVQLYVQKAADQGAGLVIFGEAFVPGYPFWVEKTNGAEFESEAQKEIHSYYQNQAVCIESGHLDSICALAARQKLAVYLGIIERPVDRGHSLYCSLVYIDSNGNIGSVHRKIMPTYEERLVWGIGDGHGLTTHALSPFTVGGLNCWENWLPLARTALHAQGEDLHVSVWPGNYRNTYDLIPMIAKEAGSYVVAVCGMFKEEELHAHLPKYDLMQSRMKGTMADGGSCVARPDGSWLLEPVVHEEGLYCVEIDHSEVRKARLSRNISGHYSRPDIFQLEVDQQRQHLLKKK